MPMMGCKVEVWGRGEEGPIINPNQSVYVKAIFQTKKII